MIIESLYLALMQSFSEVGEPKAVEAELNDLVGE
jgi:hypothetical protein